MIKYIWEVIRHTFSAQFLVALGHSFAYHIHEHVAWRAYIHAERDARIHATASIRCAQNVYVGKNSHINHLCCVWAGENSKIVLGDNVLMGPGVGIFSTNHGLVMGKPMTFQERTEESIIIGDDVWLGAHCVITAGTHIADGVVVAAGAVVTHSVTEEGAIVGGIPAKRIGKRAGSLDQPVDGHSAVEEVPGR
ncbi:MAG TPA: acyltransferase [Candidatus Binatia bacterium]|jgi:acetyltransferase-like isoleucine patch superfamily enzyme|nr:acyltransferase [Candidatus Binatia bacterium]